MKIGIITGASSGMGKYFALYSPLFYSDLDELWLVGRNVKRLVRVAKQLKISSRLFCIDLTNADDMANFIETIMTSEPDIRLLINNAGMGIMGASYDMTVDDMLSMIGINVTSLTQLTRACFPYIHNGAHIINMASAAAFIPQPDFAVYAATKSYVMSFSDALHIELSRKGVMVTTVCPGGVNTSFFRTAEKYKKTSNFKKKFRADEKLVVVKALKDSKKGRLHSIYGAPMNAFYVLCKYFPKRIILHFMK